MSYADAVNYLYGLQKYGIKLGLEKTGKILSAVGNPHRNFRSIHVAGTNGKGSVSAITASILTAHGFKTGLFTSPHLVSFTERIRIDHEQIAESDVISLTEEIRERLRGEGCDTPTFFEFVAAMAFSYFSRNNIDRAVVETGMGGRLDATNLIMPDISVITRISYDHKDFLGETLTDIANEKAGIIKNNIPAISAPQEKEAEDVILKAAKEKSAPLFVYGKDFGGALRSSGLDGIVFDYSDESHGIEDIFLPLAGEHQLVNACVAIKAAMTSLHCNIEKIKEGVKKTRWPGRLERVSSDPPIMIDGAHNPDAASALAEFIKKYLGGRRIILVMGVMSDKDAVGILAPLLPLASDIIFTAPDYGRAASPDELAGYASEMGFDSQTAYSVGDAIDMAINRVEEKISGLILITGSFYTIGEAMETLGKKAVLGDLRETI
jgi:dihydrofolate synthase/folylpolyglutamate synthase